LKLTSAIHFRVERGRRRGGHIRFLFASCQARNFGALLLDLG
jgi:hypothetical protein